MSTPPLILIDGSNWLFRAYHALPPLTAPDGTPSGAVFGMNNMIKRLIKDYQPERLAVVFDPPGKTFREDIYPEYKANRGETPAVPAGCRTLRGNGAQGSAGAGSGGR